MHKDTMLHEYRTVFGAGLITPNIEIGLIQ